MEHCFPSKMPSHVCSVSFYNTDIFNFSVGMFLSLYELWQVKNRTRFMNFRFTIEFSETELHTLRDGCIKLANQIMTIWLFKLLQSNQILAFHITALFTQTTFQDLAHMPLLTAHSKPTLLLLSENSLSLPAVSVYHTYPCILQFQTLSCNDPFWRYAIYIIQQYFSSHLYHTMHIRFYYLSHCIFRRYMSLTLFKYFSSH